VSSTTEQTPYLNRSDSNLDHPKYDLLNEAMASMPAVPQPTERPWRKYLGFSLLAVGLLSVFVLFGLAVYLAAMIAPAVTPFFAGVPRISGTVVDAVTGQPVPGMDVCLVARAQGMGHLDVDRSEMTHTDPSGKFSFAPSRQKGFGASGYELAFADPAAEMSLYCGKYLDLSPYLSQLDLPSSNDSKRLFFPTVAVEGVPQPLNDQITYASLVAKFTDPANIRIALVPLLQDENECAPIQDPINASFCRYLNRSYADAHRKRKTPSPNR
jgi:hypothetical protein